MAYTYSPLQRGEIRLLRLLPAQALDAPLKIELFPASLDGDVPEYEALTYVWNEVWGHFPVWVVDGGKDGEDAFVRATANLDAALRHLRYRSHSRVVWVDAICINQDDLAERSHQVQQMRRIYELCTADVAWLGPTPFPPPTTVSMDDITDDDWDVEEEGQSRAPTEEERQARRAQKLEDTIRRNADHRDLLIESHAAMLREGLALMRQVASHDAATLTDMIQRYHAAKAWPPIDPDDCDAQHPKHVYNPDGPLQKQLLTYVQSYALTATFSQNRLWKRVWIVQELACAPKVMLAVGIDDGDDADKDEKKQDRLITLNWDEELIGGFLDDRAYTDAFHTAWGHGTIGPVAIKTFSRVRSLHIQRKFVRAQHAQGGSEAPGDKVFRSFLDILARFKWTSSTDPRDKVYGLLGLVSEETPYLPPVDYTKPAAEVYTDTTVAIIQASGCLDLISQNPFYGSGVFSHEKKQQPHKAPNFGTGTGDNGEDAEDEAERVRNLPSWVPNFDHSEHWEYDDQFATILFAQRGIYAAGKPDCRHLLPLDTMRGWTTSPRGTRRAVSGIKLRGAVIGRMAAFRQGAWKDDSVLQGDARAPLNILVKMRSLYVGDTPDEVYSATGERLVDVFWRTMAADCTAYPIKRLDWAADGAECGRQLAEACRVREAEMRAEEQVTRHFATAEQWRAYWHGTTYVHYPPSADLLEATAVAQMLPRMLGRWDMSEAVPARKLEEREGGSNLLVMVWPDARQGDVVAVLDGSKVPVVLRPMDISVEAEPAEAGQAGAGPEWTSAAQYYKYICPAYVHGYMDGEALGQLADGQLAEQEFVLI